ncbi:hypothetical protein [Streptomyces sp. 6N223]|uniref:hypothetical protein n=1 Tax=Streptomyces sp. 6N223 TaxID=3457412 RepID=UPI003FCFCB60
MNTTSITTRTPGGAPRSRRRTYGLMATGAALLALGLTANTAVAAEAKAPTRGFKACYDLDCRKRIREGKEFNANGDYGISRISIENVGRNDISISFTGTGGGGGGCGGTPPLDCTINGVEVDAWDVEGNTAMFRFNP